MGEWRRFSVTSRDKEIVAPNHHRNRYLKAINDSGALRASIKCRAILKERRNDDN